MSANGDGELDPFKQIASGLADLEYRGDQIIEEHQGASAVTDALDGEPAGTESLVVVNLGKVDLASLGAGACVLGDWSKADDQTVYVLD